jgi:branched-chain amino acid transport system permease protein
MLTTQLLVGALVSGAIYALMGAGLNLIYGTTRLLNVAHGDLVMLGAFVSWLLFSTLNVSPLISALLVVLVFPFVGLLIYRSVFTRLFQQKLSAERIESNSLLLFFGISVILQNVVALTFTNTPRAYQYLDTVVGFGDFGITLNRALALGIAVFAVGGLTLYLTRSWWGLALRAAMQGRDLAAIVGVKVSLVHELSVAIAFGLAGLGGVLISTFEQISPFMGFTFTVSAFIVVILGGLGNVLGGMIAGFLLGAVETLGVALTGPSYRSLLLYGAFVLVLTLRPQGLWGKR